MSVTVVYVGGPVHGRVQVEGFDVWSLPRVVSFPVANYQERRFGVARYRPVAEADTPGRVTYLFDEEASTCD